METFFIALCFSGTARRHVDTIITQDVNDAIITIAMSTDAKFFSNPSYLKSASIKNLDFLIKNIISNIINNKTDIIIPTVNEQQNKHDFTNGTST